MKAAVREAVHAQWRDTVAKRNQRRVWLALAASIAVAAVALWVTRPFFSSTGEVVASVTRAIGSVAGKRWGLGALESRSPGALRYTPARTLRPDPEAAWRCNWRTAFRCGSIRTRASRSPMRGTCDCGRARSTWTRARFLGLHVPACGHACGSRVARGHSVRGAHSASRNAHSCA